MTGGRGYLKVSKSDGADRYVPDLPGHSGRPKKHGPPLKLSFHVAMRTPCKGRRFQKGRSASAKPALSADHSVNGLSPWNKSNHRRSQQHQQLMECRSAGGKDRAFLPIPQFTARRQNKRLQKKGSNIAFTPPLGLTGGIL